MSIRFLIIFSHTTLDCVARSSFDRWPILIVEICLNCWRIVTVRRSIIFTNQIPVMTWHEDIDFPTLVEAIVDRLVKMFIHSNIGSMLVIRHCIVQGWRSIYVKAPESLRSYMCPTLFRNGWSSLNDNYWPSFAGIRIDVLIFWSILFFIFKLHIFLIILSYKISYLFIFSDNYIININFSSYI